MDEEMKRETIAAIVRLQSWNVPPSLRKLADMLHLKSHNSVKQRLAKLEEEGAITVRRIPGCPNQIIIK